MSSRRKYFQGRYMHKKHLTDRAALIEQYLEKTYHDILKEAKLHADTKLNCKQPKAYQEAPVENLSVYTFQDIQSLPEPLDLSAAFFEVQEVDTSQDIQSLLESLNLPADFFNEQQGDKSYLNPEPNLQQSANPEPNLQQSANPGLPPDLQDMNIPPVSVDFFDNLEPLFTNSACLF